MRWPSLGTPQSIRNACIASMTDERRHRHSRRWRWGWCSRLPRSAAGRSIRRRRCGTGSGCRPSYWLCPWAAFARSWFQATGGCGVALRDRLLDLLQIDVVVLECGLHVRSQIGRARDLRRRGRGIGARLVDQLKHVLFLIGRSRARQQLTGFQVLESERSAELGPSHGDLLDLSDVRPVLFVNRPR